MLTNITMVKNNLKQMAGPKINAKFKEFFLDKLHLLFHNFVIIMIDSYRFQKLSNTYYLLSCQVKLINNKKIQVLTS